MLGSKAVRLTYIRARAMSSAPSKSGTPPHHTTALPPAWAEAGSRWSSPHGLPAGGAQASPAHHVGDGTFRNPWPSYTDYGPYDFLTKALPELRRVDTYALPLRPLPMAELANPTERLQSLWIGHATFFVQIDGFNVLTDPVFSRRASPSQLAGPARYTPPAATVEELPRVDVVLISHNHYDHVDAGSISRLLRKEADDMAAAARDGVAYSGTTWICPLNVGPLLVSLGVRRERLVELDWWDSASIGRGVSGAPHIVNVMRKHSASATLRGFEPVTSGVERPSIASAAPLVVTATPAQHQSARTMFDRNRTLWCGYALEGNAHLEGGRVAAYFSGDTGLRSVPRGSLPFDAAELSVPVCPAFADIGAALGPFDLAMLPIGAYSPRWFMSSFHASPEDAVRIHTDVRAVRSIGMHWGAFPLTDEPIEEPPERLREAVRRAGLAADAFVAVWPGSLVRAKAGPLDTEGGSAVIAGPIDPAAAAPLKRRSGFLPW